MMMAIAMEIKYFDGDDDGGGAVNLKLIPPLLHQNAMLCLLSVAVRLM
jgi:hypothetical protein